MVRSALPKCNSILQQRAEIMNGATCWAGLQLMFVTGESPTQAISDSHVIATLSWQDRREQLACLGG